MRSARQFSELSRANSGVQLRWVPSRAPPAAPRVVSPESTSKTPKLPSVCFPNSSITTTPTTSKSFRARWLQYTTGKHCGVLTPLDRDPFLILPPFLLFLQLPWSHRWAKRLTGVPNRPPVPPSSSHWYFWGYFILLTRIVLSLVPARAFSCLRLSPNLDRRCWAFWLGSGTVHGTNQRQVTGNPPFESLIYALPRTQIGSSYVAQHSTSHPSIPPDPRQPWIGRLAFRADLKAVPSTATRPYSPHGAFGALQRLGARSNRSGSQI